MTVQEFVIKTLELKEQIIKFDVPLRIAAYTTLAAQSQRIFSEGKNESNQQLVYDYKTPIYVNPKDSPKGFKPAGKPKANKKGELVSPKKKFGNIKFGGAKGAKVEVDRATKYFESYKDFKSFIGRPRGGSYVSFELFGDLKKDFENPKGNTPEPVKVNDHEYITRVSRDINQKKVEGFNEKYGGVFGLSKEEKQLFFDTVAFEFKRLAEKYA